jgi:hypothetical protein
MAFLFQDQNQGITERHSRANAAAATVLFHPDFNRRLRNRTESADPSSWRRKALAGLGCFALTAGGDFHPALRTSAARYERPVAIMAKRGRRSKNLGQRNPHARMTK